MLGWIEKLHELRSWYRQTLKKDKAGGRLIMDYFFWYVYEKNL
jgi:hypothetical protein